MSELFQLVSLADHRVSNEHREPGTLDTVSGAAHRSFHLLGKRDRGVVDDDDVEVEDDAIEVDDDDVEVGDDDVEVGDDVSLASALRHEFPEIAPSSVSENIQTAAHHRPSTSSVSSVPGSTGRRRRTGECHP